MSIEFKEGAVCFAGGRRWYFNDSVKPYKLVNNMQGTRLESYAGVINMPDFQINTIKQGDYIEASELDTEQEYNDVVEVFGLFGFDVSGDFEWFKDESCIYDLFFIDGCKDLDSCVKTYRELKRKLTYPQIIAIGELKRLEIERDKSASKTATELTAELTADLVQKPSHYQFFEGVEVIEIIASSMTREQFKGYCLGNRIKYRLRAGNKDKLKQEIAKSDKYVELYNEHKHLCRIDGDLK